MQVTKRSRMSSLAVVLMLGLVVAACDSGEAELSTTSSLVTGSTEAPVEPTSTSTTEAGDVGPVTPTTLRGQTVDSFEITARIPSDNGEILYIVVPASDAYTDVDMENFIGDLLEGDPDLWGAEVFRSEEGPVAFVIPEDQRTEEQQQVIDEHHLASLIGGDTLVFRGPFEDVGQMIIGS